LDLKVDKLTAGFVTGLWAAVAQAVVYVAPPSAFGICFISHPSDFIDWIVNHLFGTTLYVHDPSVDIPVLTVVGVLVGASISTLRNKEFSFRLPRHPLDHFINGFFVAMFGLTLGYCSVHIIMSVMYGSFVAIVGLIGMISGVVISANYIRWRVRL
jgi:hypothetical protein